jgi:hypothetical protein
MQRRKIELSVYKNAARQNWVVSQREWVAKNLHSLALKISPNKT